MSEFNINDIKFDDGRNNRANLGFILLSTDLACEIDTYRMAPEGVGCLLYTSPSPRDDT